MSPHLGRVASAFLVGAAALAFAADAHAQIYWGKLKKHNITNRFEC